MATNDSNDNNNNNNRGGGGWVQVRRGKNPRQGESLDRDKG